MYVYIICYEYNIALFFKKADNLLLLTKELSHRFDLAENSNNTLMADISRLK
jgi:hypothetical protein